MAIPTCESEFGLYACSGGAPVAGARPWIAQDLLISRDSNARYNLEDSFYNRQTFGGAFGPVSLPGELTGGAVPGGFPVTYDAAGNPVVGLPVNPNHLEANSLAPIVILGIAALLLLS